MLIIRLENFFAIKNYAFIWSLNWNVMNSFITHSLTQTKSKFKYKKWIWTNRNIMNINW